MTRAVVGVVVGIAIFAFVGVVGYFAVVTVGMRSWADQRDASAERSVASAPASAPAGTGTGRETTLDASNEAYRQRQGTPERDAEAARSVPAVRAALDPVADGSAVDADEVATALAAAGFETVQVVGTTASGEVATTVGVGVAVPGGCVFGGVAPDAVTLEAGGPIADGGCLEMPAHCAPRARRLRPRGPARAVREAAGAGRSRDLRLYLGTVSGAGDGARTADGG
ncbi:MAG: DUF6993 domain-containing protein [Cellulosimicrobium funkei]